MSDKQSLSLVTAAMLISEVGNEWPLLDLRHVPSADYNEPRFPKRLFRVHRGKSQSKALPDKKAARKRQKKARAITRRNRP